MVKMGWRVQVVETNPQNYEYRENKIENECKTFTNKCINDFLNDRSIINNRSCTKVNARNYLHLRV